MSKNTMRVFNVKASPFCAGASLVGGFTVIFLGVLAANEAYRANHKNDGPASPTESLTAASSEVIPNSNGDPAGPGSGTCVLPQWSSRAPWRNSLYDNDDEAAKAAGAFWSAGQDEDWSKKQSDPNFLVLTIANNCNEEIMLLTQHDDLGFHPDSFPKADVAIAPKKSITFGEDKVTANVVRAMWKHSYDAIGDKDPNTKKPGRIGGAVDLIFQTQIELTDGGKMTRGMQPNGANQHGFSLPYALGFFDQNGLILKECPNGSDRANQNAHTKVAGNYAMCAFDAENCCPAKAHRVKLTSEKSDNHWYCINPDSHMASISTDMHNPTVEDCIDSTEWLKQAEGILQNNVPNPATLKPTVSTKWANTDTVCQATNIDMFTTNGGKIKYPLYGEDGVELETFKPKGGGKEYQFAVAAACNQPPNKYWSKNGPLKYGYGNSVAWGASSPADLLNQCKSRWQEPGDKEKCMTEVTQVFGETPSSFPFGDVVITWPADDARMWQFSGGNSNDAKQFPFFAGEGVVACKPELPPHGESLWKELRIEFCPDRPGE